MKRGSFHLKVLRLPRKKYRADLPCKPPQNSYFSLLIRRYRNEKEKTKERKAQIQFSFKYMVRVPSFVEIQSHDDGDLRDLRAIDRSGRTAFGAFTVHHRGIRFKRVYGG